MTSAIWLFLVGAVMGYSPFMSIFSWNNKVSLPISLLGLGIMAFAIEMFVSIH